MKKLIGMEPSWLGPVDQRALEHWVLFEPKHSGGEFSQCSGMEINFSPGLVAGGFFCFVFFGGKENEETWIDLLL